MKRTWQNSFKDFLIRLRPWIKRKVEKSKPFLKSRANDLLWVLNWYYFIIYGEDKLDNELSNPNYDNWGVPGNSAARLRKIRFINIKESIFHNPASTFSFVLAYISILIGFIYYLIASEWGYQWWVILLKVVCVVAGFVIINATLFLPAPYYLRRYIFSLPLEEYSAFIQGSLSESDMITFISYKIWRQCEKFESKTEWVRDYLVTDEEQAAWRDAHLSSGSDSDRNKVTEALLEKAEDLSQKKVEITDLARAISEWEIELQGIAILIKKCSERLRISEVEVSEHLFQFSRSMYWAWLKKFSANLETVSELYPYIKSDSLQIRKATLDRIRSFLYECYRFRVRNEKFMRYQCQNMSFSDLHSGILLYATESSSSAAVKNYIRMLSKVSQQYIDHKAKVEAEGAHKLLPPLEKIFYERIFYIYHKRKLHIGIDFHMQVGNIIKAMEAKQYVDVVALVKIFADQVTTAVSGSGIVADQPHAGIPDNGNNFIQQQNTFEKARKAYFNGKIMDTNFLLESATDIAMLHKRVIAFFEASRMGIKDKLNLNKDLINFISGTDDLFIITCGNSKMVRDTIKYYIRDYLPGGENRAIPQRKFKIAIFDSESESQIESRQIKYHISEEEKRSYKNVIVGSPDYILPFVDKDCKLLILLGAEAYDEKGRVLRTNSHALTLEKFIKDSQVPDDRRKIFVFAESFKKFKDLLPVIDDQYDNIEVLDPRRLTMQIIDEL